jgi:hypothetical protein
MSIDGRYGFVYCGAVDVGLGAFIITDGKLVGADYGRGLYRGTATENVDGTITIKVTFRVARRTAQGQGASPADGAYEKMIEQTFPRDFGDGQPLPTFDPPATIMVRRLHPKSDLTKMLGLEF